MVERKYRYVVENGVTYFLNNAGEVVATENTKHNILVMYVYSNRDTVWNHHDTVAVAIAKDFMLVHNYEVHLADVIAMVGLCGAIKTIERTSNMLLEETSSRNLSFDAESYNLVEPVQIIDRGILDSPQFAHVTLKGACISVTVKDANGTVAKVPYIVGHGLVSKAKKIGTMGSMESSHIWNFDNLVYGILSYKKLSRKAKKKKRVKYVQTKDYNVYNTLRNNNSWNWEAGYDTCNSNQTRALVMSTKHGTNYHKIAPVTVTITK